MKRLITFVMLALTLLLPARASAQEAVIPSVVDSTMAVSPTVRAAVDAWLAVSAPVPLPYYAITYVEPRITESFVSLVALTIPDPSAPWHLTDSADVAWMGSIIVSGDDSVQLITAAPFKEGGAGIRAAPSLAGGGSSVRFPWQGGGTMMYGPRGVHEAGYGTGMSAVDFVGGDDMGSGVARAQAYAVAGGTVDYVCKDATSVAVRAAGGGNSYVYAHLLDNANLTAGHAFGAGSMVGSLKYGSFDDQCGWAQQKDTQYHLHFGFAPAGGAFRMENCILNIASKKWACGTKTVSTGQFLVGGGGVGVGGDGVSNTISQPSFWDYALTGAVALWDKMVIQNMPSHSAIRYTYVIYSTAKLVIRLARALVYSNVNLGPLMAVLVTGFGIKILFGIAEFIVFLFKTWKSLAPVVIGG